MSNNGFRHRKCQDLSCGHRAQQHSTDKEEDFACKVKGCPCVGFDDGEDNE